MQLCPLPRSARLAQGARSAVAGGYERADKRESSHGRNVARGDRERQKLDAQTRRRTGENSPREAGARERRPVRAWIMSRQSLGSLRDRRNSALLAVRVYAGRLISTPRPPRYRRGVGLQRTTSHAAARVLRPARKSISAALPSPVSRG